MQGDSLAENLLETISSEFLTSRSPAYQVAAASSIPSLVTPSASLQSSFSPYQISSYPMSTLGPYAGIYSQAVVQYTQTPANTYSLNSSLLQPGLINSADLISIDPYLNKSSTTKFIMQFHHLSSCCLKVRLQRQIHRKPMGYLRSQLQVLT